MRICHFSETSVNGAYFEHITKGLVAKGVQVTLLELGCGKPPVWLNEMSGVEYFSLNIRSRIQYPLAVWRLVRLLNRQKIDFLQAHLYNAGIISVLARHLTKAKIILNRHHTSVVRLLGSSIHVKLDKWMATNADHVVTVSEAARNYMRDVDGVQRPIDVVHLGFDFDRFSPNERERERIRSEFHFDDDNFVIGYVGNFAPGKGHVNLIEAYAEVLKSIPNARLLLVGKGRLQEVEDVIGRVGLGRRIALAGWRNDISACLNAMDIFVQPSHSEAFSQVLIEAMGVGLPIVATNVGGASEVIDDRVNGFLVEPNNSAEIALRISELFEDVELRTLVSQKGRQSVRDRFTIANMVDRQYELYLEWQSNTNN